MKTSLLIAASVSVAGCSLINDFSIGDAGTDAGARDASSDAAHDAAVDGGSIDAGTSDAGPGNVCAQPSDRAAIRRSDITVGTETGLTYEEALFACAHSAACHPRATSFDRDEVIACVDACLAAATAKAPATAECRGCFAASAPCMFGVACEPCQNEPSRCLAPGQPECNCEACWCGECAAALASCTGLSVDLCVGL